MSDSTFTELLPLGPDTTEYRHITSEGVRMVDTPFGSMLQVDQ